MKAIKENSMPQQAKSTPSKSKDVSERQENKLSTNKKSPGATPLAKKNGSNTNFGEKNFQKNFFKNSSAEKFFEGLKNSNTNNDQLNVSFQINTDFLDSFQGNIKSAVFQELTLLVQDYEKRTEKFTAVDLGNIIKKLQFPLLTIAAKIKIDSDYEQSPQAIFQALYELHETFQIENFECDNQSVDSDEQHYNLIGDFDSYINDLSQLNNDIGEYARYIQQIMELIATQCTLNQVLSGNMDLDPLIMRKCHQLLPRKLARNTTF